MDESKKVEEPEEFEGFKPWNHKDGERLVKRNLGLLAAKIRSR